MSAVASQPGPAAVAPAPKAKPSPLHIPSLDGLRAISFMIVFVAHAGLERVVPGGFGVTVFFFLSGYLITTLMRLENERKGDVSLKHFYLRRVLRILPPFYLVLVAAIALSAVGVVGGPPQAAPVGSQLLHFSNYWIAFKGWSGVPEGTGVYWSLAVEEHFYFLFPAFFLLLNRRLRLDGRQQAFAFWALCAAVLAWRCVLVFVLHSATDRTYLCSDTRIDSIAYGCALAVWKNPVLDDAREGRKASAPPLGLFAGAIALLLVTFLVRDDRFRESIRYSMQGIALTPIFTILIRFPRWFVARPLNWKPLRFVGTLSYSLYLVHQVVLAALAHHAPLPEFVRGVLALGISFGLAWAMYEVVEKPCAKLRKRFSD